MVKKGDVPKLGFIVEGATEKIILEQTDFFKFLKSKKIEFVSDIIDAKGCDNLLPHNREAHIKTLNRKGANKIIILTDLDDEPCITEVKNRITEGKRNQTIVVALKEIESWFLADTEAMKTYLKDDSFICVNPEAITDPYETIKKLRMDKVGIGTGVKTALAKTLASNHNFRIERAAAHGSCNSAKYFLETVINAAQ